MPLAGVGQEVFTASILIVAVLMLGWHNLWMASHGREMAQQMQAMGRQVAAGQKSLAAMAVVVGVAVLREGAEVVLFLYGIAASEQARARRRCCWAARWASALAPRSHGCCIAACWPSRSSGCSPPRAG